MLFISITLQDLSLTLPSLSSRVKVDFDTAEPQDTQESWFNIWAAGIAVHDQCILIGEEATWYRKTWFRNYAG